MLEVLPILIILYYVWQDWEILVSFWLLRISFHLTEVYSGSGLVS